MLVEQKKPVKRKYGFRKYQAKKVEIDGISFDSIQEGEYYKYLKERVLNNEINSEIDVHPKFELQPAFDKFGRHYNSITYEADFKYIDKNGKVHIEDVKGFKTKEFMLKKKMFEYKYPALTLDLIKHTKRDGWFNEEIKEEEKKQLKKQLNDEIKKQRQLLNYQDKQRAKEKVLISNITSLEAKLELTGKLNKKEQEKLDKSKLQLKEIQNNTDLI